MTKQVFIINGSGGVGKDTVCSAAAQSWKVQNISSITPILQVAKAAGWGGTAYLSAYIVTQIPADGKPIDKTLTQKCKFRHVCTYPASSAAN